MVGRTGRGERNRRGASGCGSGGCTPHALSRTPCAARRSSPTARSCAGRQAGLRAHERRAVGLSSKTTFPCRTRHSGAGPNPGVLLFDSFTVAGAASALRGVLSTAAHRLPVSPWPPRRLHGAPGHLTTRTKCISRLRQGSWRACRKGQPLQDIDWTLPNPATRRWQTTMR